MLSRAPTPTAPDSSSEQSSARVAAVYRTCFPVIEAKCRRLFRNSAEAQDVAQEVFARLLASDLAPRLNEVAPMTLLGWVYRVSGRVAIDYVRTTRRRSALLAAEPAEAEPRAGEGSGEGSLDARRVMAALWEEVPAAELEAAILCRVDRLTHEQSAAVLGTSERTIRRHLSRFDERVAGHKKELLK